MKQLLVLMVILTCGCASQSYRFGEELTEQKLSNPKYANIIVKIAAINPIESSAVESAKNAIFVISENVKNKKGKKIIKKNEAVSALITVHTRGGGRPGKIIIEFQKAKDIKGKPVYFNSEPMELEGTGRSDVAIPAGHVFQIKINSAEDKLYSVNVPKLVIRKGPSSKSKKIGILKSGTVVKIIKVTDKTEVLNDVEGKWMKLYIDERETGYVFGGFLKPADSQNIKIQIKQ